MFEDQGKPWFAMGLVEGRTLRSLLAQRGALPAEDVARYGEILADALRAAHAKHVLHRDVTPGNIFITPDGRLLLGDFGLALVPATPDAATATISSEHVAGTLGYMSPEQMTDARWGRKATSSRPASCCTRWPPAGARSAAVRSAKCSTP